MKTSLGLGDIWLCGAGTATRIDTRPDRHTETDTGTGTDTLTDTVTGDES